MTLDAASLAPFLDVFPDWLRTLGADAAAMSALLESEGSEDARRHVAGALNYIFKSLDLIPDGIDDLGFCDDAFVLRVAASLAIEADGEAHRVEVVVRLAQDVAHLRAFLGDDYARLVAYVQGLRKAEARGRTVDDIMTDGAARSALLHEVAAWAAAYTVPTFTRDTKTLIKLRAFLNAKLA